MSDRELLELAAKAAGYQIVLGKNDSDRKVLKPEQFYMRDNHGVRHIWTPLTDDGDAMRLAVAIAKFNRVICISIGCGRSLCEFLDENHGSDPHATTRRAIVRAAAGLGKAML